MTPKAATPPCGFQRLNGYPRAARASDLAAWLDVPIRPDDAIASARSRPSGRTAKAIVLLDELVDELAQSPDYAFVLSRTLSETICPDAEIVLGLDRKDGRSRMRAMIARAYADAEQLADAYADKREAAAKAEVIAKRIDGFLKRYMPEDRSHRLDQEVNWEQRGSIHDEVAVLARWQADQKGYSKEWGRKLSHACVSLHQWAEELHKFKRGSTRRGRPEDVPRLFFVLRLAELFALSTGIKPTFHATRKTDAAAERPWFRFLETVSEIVGIPFATQGLDALLRAIGDTPLYRWRVEDFADLAHGLKTDGLSWWVKKKNRKVWQLGEFQSCGLRLDYHLISDSVALPRRD